MGNELDMSEYLSKEQRAAGCTLSEVPEDEVITLRCGDEVLGQWLSRTVKLETISHFIHQHIEGRKSGITFEKELKRW